MACAGAAARRVARASTFVASRVQSTVLATAVQTIQSPAPSAVVENACWRKGVQITAR